VARLRLVDDVVVENASAILGELLAQIESDPDDFSPDVIEIDCSEMTFIDSSGLAMLVKLRTRTGTKLVLIGMPENCRRPFAITRLENLFEAPCTPSVNRTQSVRAKGPLPQCWPTARRTG
jgi:anti-anti-sigma factor